VVKPRSGHREQAKRPPHTADELPVARGAVEGDSQEPRESLGGPCDCLPPSRRIRRHRSLEFPLDSTKLSPEPAQPLGHLRPSRGKVRPDEPEMGNQGQRLGPIGGIHCSQALSDLLDRLKVANLDNPGSTEVQEPLPLHGLGRPDGSLGSCPGQVGDLLTGDVDRVDIVLT